MCDLANDQTEEKFEDTRSVIRSRKSIWAGIWPVGYIGSEQESDLWNILDPHVSKKEYFFQNKITNSKSSK
jgi:hypothetical protein